MSMVNHPQKTTSQRFEPLSRQQPAALKVDLEHTAGNGNIVSRVNCNEFMENIATNYGFVLGQVQDRTLIIANVPAPYLTNFNFGLTL